MPVDEKVRRGAMAWWQLIIEDNGLKYFDSISHTALIRLLLGIGTKLSVRRSDVLMWLWCTRRATAEKRGIQ
jgi:hypothetical protein